VNAPGHSSPQVHRKVLSQESESLEQSGSASRWNPLMLILNDFQKESRIEADF
jgi:hypothetical protein